MSALKAAQPAVEAEAAAAERDQWIIRLDDIRAEAASAERERILVGLDAIQVTLTRPGYGNGPAHDEHQQVVLASKLRDLINHIDGN